MVVPNIHLWNRIFICETEYSFVKPDIHWIFEYSYNNQIFEYLSEYIKWLTSLNITKTSIKVLINDIYP